MPHGTSTQRRLVSIAAAAEYLGVNPRTVRRRISDGTIKGYRVGPTLLRVDLNSIDKLLREIPAGGNDAA